MSVERCFECGRQVDTDFDVEGDYFSGEGEASVPVYLCRWCVAAEEELRMQMMTEQRANK